MTKQRIKNVSIAQLEWGTYKGLIGYKLLAFDCFGNEFARLDLKPGYAESDIERFKAESQARYERLISKHIIIETEEPE